MWGAAMAAPVKTYGPSKLVGARSAGEGGHRQQLQITSKEALERLGAITGHVRIVALTGPKRRGKSTLLNLVVRELLRKLGVNAALQSFRVLNTQDPVTSGIDMIILQGPGEAYAILDTEGSGDLQQDSTFHTSLLALAAGLSSVFIINSGNSLDHETVNVLATLGYVGTNLYGHGGGKDRPELVVAFRDHCLQTTGTATDYLQTQLERAVDRPKAAMVMSAYPKRTGIFFPYPVALMSPEHLADVSALKPEDLSPGFRQAVAELVRTITASGVKKCSNQPMTGPQLVVMAQALISQLNEGRQKHLATTFEGIQQKVESDAKKAAKTEAEAYMERSGALRGLDERHLVTTASCALVAARAAFDKRVNDLLDKERSNRIWEEVKADFHERLQLELGLLRSRVLAAEAERRFEQAQALAEQARIDAQREAELLRQQQSRAEKKNAWIAAGLSAVGLVASVVLGVNPVPSSS